MCGRTAAGVCYTSSRGLTENLPKFLRSWKGDGIVARIENEKIAKAVADLGVPTVDLRGSHRPVNGAMLDTDPRIVTRMAAEHFLDIGFRHFAYIGFPGVDFSERRLTAYVEYLKSRGWMFTSIATSSSAIAYGCARLGSSR